MKNKNNNKTIYPSEEIMAEIEEDLTRLLEILQEKYEGDFPLVELYVVFDKIALELKTSLEDLNIVDEQPPSEEVRAYLKTLN